MPNDAIIGQEQHYFRLLQCTLISILLYLSHLLQDKTLYGRASFLTNYSGPRVGFPCPTTIHMKDTFNI